MHTLVRTAFAKLRRDVKTARVIAEVVTVRSYRTALDAHLLGNPQADITDERARMLLHRHMIAYWNLLHNSGLDPDRNEYVSVVDRILKGELLLKDLPDCPELPNYF